jgi:NAD+ synthase (glutamine-hydrolysing)
MKSNRSGSQKTAAHWHMKIGIAQINTIVGDLIGNQKLILDAYADLLNRGAELVVFPELTVCGYPPLDLLLKRSFVQECESAVHAIAEQSTIPMILGAPARNASGRGKPCHNTAWVCANGRILRQVHKQLLPTYDVFDEKRYFEPGPPSQPIQIGGKIIAITICEDIWVDDGGSSEYDTDPVIALQPTHPDVLINLSGSPWYMGKQGYRLHFMQRAARTLNCPVVYCNLVGGNDELVFDGSSKVVCAEGHCRSRLASFCSENRVVDLDQPGDLPALEPLEQGMEAVYHALVLGVRDYAQKTGFRSAIIGLSGGIDSAVTAVIAAEALGHENVTGVSLPSAISSQHSRDDARELAENLGIRYETIPIHPVVAAVEQTLQPQFANTRRDVTEENIQARSRGILLMALSNKFGSLLLTTGNKSEMAVGYCTLYGDMAGGLAVLCDVFKTVVFKLAEWINRDRIIIPVSTITKPPSAELRPDQKDEDSLPPYPILDAVLKGYIEEGMNRADLIKAGFDSELVKEITRKVDLNEYKRKQAPPGIKITSLAFGMGRRIPIVQKYIG